MGQQKKVIVFIACSAFQILESALIGELYYRGAWKILLDSPMSSSHAQERALRSSLFDEVLCRSHSSELEEIEQMVDEFLESHPPIDELFICDIYHQVGTALVHRLRGKTKLHRVQDGMGPFVATRKYYEINFQHTFARNEEIKAVFEKYPFEEEVFETYWTCDENIVLETPGTVVKRIAIEELLEDDQDMIEKLNILFDFHDDLVENYDAIYFDSWLVDRNLMDASVEQEILHHLEACLRGKKILVKPKPAQDPLYTAAKFGNMDVDICRQMDTPWEVVYLNWLIKSAPEKIVLILPFFSSVACSSVYLSKPDTNINILVLQDMGFKGLKPHMRESLKKGSADVAEFLRSKSNVQVFIPKKADELQHMCAQIFGSSSLRDFAVSAANPCRRTAPYFYRVGNLLTRSSICDGHGKVFKTCFDFLPEVSELSFLIDEEVDLTTIKWRPSESGVFSTLSLLKVYAVGKDGSKKMIYFLEEEKPGDKNTFSFARTGLLDLHTGYRGYCKKICIEAKLHTRASYSELADTLKTLIFRERQVVFWENWYSIKNTYALELYGKINKLENVWVLGDGRIGTEIKTAFDELEISTKFVGTRTKEKAHYKVFLLTDVLEREGLPDLFVIASLYDLAEILDGLPDSLRKRTLSADELVSNIRARENTETLNL